MSARADFRSVNRPKAPRFALYPGRNRRLTGASCEDRAVSDRGCRRTRRCGALIAVAAVLLCALPSAATAVQNSSLASVLNSSTGPEMTVFYPNVNNEAAYWLHTSLGWSKGIFGGSIKESTSPAAIIDPDNSDEWMYYVNSSSEIGLFVTTGGKWSGPDDIGGIVAANSSPAVVLNNPAGPYSSIFYVNSKHEIAYWYWQNGWYSGTFGGKVNESTSPAAMVDPANGDVWVYFVNTNNEIELFANTGKWSGPDDIGGKVATASSPAIVLNSASGPYSTIFYVNSKHEIAYWHWENGWTSGTLGGSVAEGTSPAATVNTFNGHMYVYYVNSSSEIAAFSYNGATWTGPTKLGGKVASNSSPTALLDSNDQYVYFLNGSDEVETFTNTGEWVGPSSL